MIWGWIMRIEVRGLDDRVAGGGGSEDAARVGGCSEEVPKRFDRAAQSCRIAIVTRFRLLTKVCQNLQIPGCGEHVLANAATAHKIYVLLIFP